MICCLVGPAALGRRIARTPISLSRLARGQTHGERALLERALRVRRSSLSVHARLNFKLRRLIRTKAYLLVQPRRRQMPQELFRIQKVVFAEVLLYGQVVPILASSHHAGVHFLAAAYGGHRHAFCVGLHEIVVHDRMRIGHARHPAGGLRGLLRRFSSIYVQIPFGFDRDFLALHCLFLALLNG